MSAPAASAAGSSPVQPYAPGSWGPPKAQKLIEDDGRRWMPGDADDQPIVACKL